MHDITQDLGRRVTACRMCGGTDLERYLDLGHTPPADQFRRADQLGEPSVHFPLEVCVCSSCGLSQLGYVVAPQILYQDEYPYEASTTQAGRRHFRAFAASVARRYGIGADDLVVDIGSNVGVLLSGFADEGARVLGVDPAHNIAAIANERGIPTLAEFFGPAVVSRIVREHGQATAVCGTNVFAHVDDLDTFMRAVDELLAPDGMFIFEAPYFANLLSSLEYDTIYHEHLSYISVKPLLAFFARFGMRIFDIREVDIHGGSFRIFVDRCRRDVEPGLIERFLAREEREGAHDARRLHRFAGEVAENRRQLVELLRELRASGKRLAGVSAPAKGMTLLNYCRIGTETLDFVTEKSRLKIGRYTPGTHIPVVPDAELVARRPDFALLLAWNFATEIMGNLREYRAAGGRFIIPIPEPRVVGSEEKVRAA
ncbi:MAG: methyltransferase domain-containing protein [Dehalococcoidia bacterium]|nr:MAG: methyltransferase domain-containing protein [Dehalococcoidia bacterium]